jgi:hypothetical protein
MRRWQYKVVRHRSLLRGGNSDTQEDPDCEAILDRYGEDGWELVSVAVQSYRREYDPTALQGYSFFTYVFKREAT